MNVPGSNLLLQAQRIIAAQNITYLAYQSRASNAIGNWVNTYASPVTIQGSLQPVPRSLMQILGLDMNKSYVNIFVPQAVIDIARDVSSDQFKFAGVTYQALSITPWINIDGWNQVLAVMVPANA